MYRQPIEQLEPRRLLDGEGLSAIYFNNGDFTGTNVSRVETVIDMAWSSTTPGAGIGNGFSSRFAGRVTAVESGSYTFSVQVGGSVRLWVDDVLLIDQFTNQTTTHRSAAVALTAGKSYHIVLEYRGTGSTGSSAVKLVWTRPGQTTAQVIPQAQLSSDNRVFPSNAGLFNVKTLFGAVGNGIADDTDAIQLAIEFARGASWGGSVYFPNGTYRVTNTLDFVSASHVFLRGQNRDNVVIKLDDNAGGFANPAAPKPLLSMYSVSGGATGNQFGNSIYDMTFDTGANNPGANGMTWLNNNQGSMRDVTVRTSDPTRRGVVGVDLSVPWPGPALFTNVLVDGFDYAFRNTGNFNYSQTYEHVRIQNQKVNGIFNSNGSMFFNDFRSINTVTAFANVSDSSSLLMINSELTGGGGANPAIVNYGSVMLRDVNTSRYNASLAYFWNLPAYISEFSTGAEFVGNGPVQGFNVRDGAAGFAPSSLKSLDLPIEDPPRAPEDAPSLWVAVNGAAADDTANIQAAFNTAAAQGRSTVYFPKATYVISGPITVSGSVRRIVGLGSTLAASGALASGTGSAFIFAPSLLGDVTVEGFVTNFTGQHNFYWFDDRTQQSLYLRNIILNDGSAYKNSVTGKRLFIDDVTGTRWDFTNQKVWARQLNPESRSRTNIISTNTDFWAIGVKMEYENTLLDNRSGSRAEILGSFIYGIDVQPNTPLFLNTDSMLSITSAGSWATNWVREVRSGVTQNFTTPQTVGPAGWRKIPLYSSNLATSTVVAASNLAALSTSPASITLRWTDNANNESGFIIQRKNGSAPFTTIAMLAADATVFSDFNLFAGTAYSYRVLAAGGPNTDTFSNTAVAVTLPGPPAAPTNLSLATTPTSVTLSWTDIAENETSYVLERSLDGSSFVALATLPAGSVEYIDANLSPATPFSYRLKATNALGTSANTPVATVLTRPAIPVLPAISDSGFDPADRITRQTRPEFTGTAKPGVTIKLLINGVLSRSVVTPASGVFRLSPPTALASGAYSATVVASMLSFPDSVPSDNITFTIDTVSPTASVGSFAPGTQVYSQPFSEDVGPSIANIDIALTNLTTKRGYKGSRLAVTFDDVTRTARVSLPPLPPGGTSRLPDGNYRLKADNNTIEDRAGNYLANNLVADFYVLEGDVNRDRNVSAADLQILTSNLGATGAAYGQGDLNGDGTVNQTDLDLLQSRLGNALPPPPPFVDLDGTRPRRAPPLSPPPELGARRSRPAIGLPLPQSLQDARVYAGGFELFDRESLVPSDREDRSLSFLSL